MKTSQTNIGRPISHKHWVQTEREAHEHWARLIARKPRAAQLMHILVANMGDQNAIVCSQSTLAQLMNVSIDTVQRASKDLAKEKWIQIVKIGKGKESAYVINDRVAWSENRDRLRLSLFTATVIANEDEQDETSSIDLPLRRIPVIHTGERQLPTGDGAPPPSQPSFDGMEPDLPSRKER